MAEREQVEILRQGMLAWNLWRDKFPTIRPNLSGESFRGMDLGALNFVAVNLSMADLEEVDLTKADLRGANFYQANLRQADLSGAMLGGANCELADLSRASLAMADLSFTNLNWAQLHEARCHDCIMDGTILSNNNLSTLDGLETVHHGGPSEIGISTIYRSNGKIPEVFLRGAGVPDNFIKYMYTLVSTAFEFYSCFISYSTKDQEFATRLHADLQSKGVRCWFAPEDLKIGDKLRPSFDEAIRLHDKLMVILSESSVKSAWVEKEVETAFEKERKQSRTVLFPIRLDDAVMETRQAWTADIRRTRHIGDFRNWKNHNCFKKAFDRLLRDLKAEGKAESSKQE
jgi:uncharacterized protein YjbI with pentapeptide repeats